MISKSKIALIAALAVSIASPAFAQSFNKSDGTGNELPFAYGPAGTKQSWTVVTPQNDQVATRQIGAEHFAARENSRTRFAATSTRNLYNYAGAPLTFQADPNANSPALTGGGSAGYNQMLLNY